MGNRSSLVAKCLPIAGENGPSHRQTGMTGPKRGSRRSGASFVQPPHFSQPDLWPRIISGLPIPCVRREPIYSRASLDPYC